MSYTLLKKEFSIRYVSLSIERVYSFVSRGNSTCSYFLELHSSLDASYM